MTDPLHAPADHQDSDPLAALAALAPQCLAQVQGAVLLTTADRVLYANPAAERLFGGGLASGAAGGMGNSVVGGMDGTAALPGPGSAALPGRAVAEMLEAPFRAPLRAAQEATSRSGQVSAGHDIRCLRLDGTVFDARIWAAPLQLQGRPVYLITLACLAELRQAQQRIEELVNFDEVTGLANRNHLLQRIGASQRSAVRDSQQLALLAITLPRITELASSMGFGAGDALAMALAARLRQQCQPHERVAHLGGADFALLTARQPVLDSAALLHRAGQLRHALQQPVPLGDSEILPSCRIGIACFPQDGSNAASLLEAAQTACAQAQANALADVPGAAGATNTAGAADAPGAAGSAPAAWPGGTGTGTGTGPGPGTGTSFGTPNAGIALYHAASAPLALRNLQIESALRHALRRHEFTLVYQPQVDLASGKIVGAEALLRWQSAECGEVPPDVFIPVAERTGLIAAIGDWVIHQACTQIMLWRAQGLPALRVGINISPLQFQLGDVASSIHRALAATGAPASALGVELTESALLHDGERVAATLHALRASGIEIALDDFGTGFSSLGRLRSLPIDLLKIDRCFVSDVTAAPDSASLTRSIINLAHGLQIPVLAEGVETAGQLKMLAANGCDRIQGYLFSRPLKPEALAEMLRNGQRMTSHLAPQPVRQRTLLLVDDEPNILAALRRLFRPAGYQLLTAGSGLDALELLATHPVDVILTDQRMPGISGVELLRRAKALSPHSIRMTLSGFTDLQSIIDAVNESAVYKFLIKPWDDARLLEHVAQAFAQKELADENRRLQAELHRAHAEQATLNQRLAQLVGQQRAQADLLQAGADSVRDLVDLLPAAVFGVGADGMLAYLNQPAASLLPDALAGLGGDPSPELAQLLATLHRAATPHSSAGHRVLVRQQPHRAWLKAMPAPAMAPVTTATAAPVTAATTADGAPGLLLVLLPDPPQATC